MVDMWEKIKAEAQKLVLWAEQNLRDKSGIDRRKAVISKMCEAIDLPYVPGFVEGFIEPILYGFVVDAVVKVWDLVTGKAFGALSLSPEVVGKTGELINAAVSGGLPPVDLAGFAAETSGLPLDEKFDALLAKYGVS
jgi:hypothetical protein